MTKREHEALKAKWWDEYYQKQRSHFVQTVETNPILYNKKTDTEDLEQPKEVLVEADSDELDYGQVEVLTDCKKKLTIKNKSKIAAEYTAFTKQNDSIWKVIQRHGVIQPGYET